MRYLLLIVFILSLGACQKSPKMETLEAEKAGLILLYEKETEKTAQLRQEAVALMEQAINSTATAKTAEAQAILALEEAQFVERGPRKM